MKAASVLIGLLAVLIAPALIYLGSERHARLPDDEQVVWSNPAVTGAASGQAFKGMFYNWRQDGFHSAVRPVATMATRLEWSQFHQDRAGFQWVQVLLLGLIGVVFFSLLRRQLKSSLMAALGSLVLVAHPVGAWSVLTLAGISDLLALLFLLLSLSMSERLLRPNSGRPRSVPLLLALVFLLLAVWSKETAFVGVPILLVWTAARLLHPTAGSGGGLDRQSQRRALALGLGAGLVAVVALGQRWVVIGGLPENLQIGRAVLIDSGWGWGRRVLLGLGALPTCGRLLLFPTTLGYAHDYLMNAGMPGVRAAAGVLILGGLGWVLVDSIRRASDVIPWAALSLFSLLGAVGVAGPVGDLAPQRILLQALPGLIAMVLAGVVAIRPMFAGRKWQWVMVAWGGLLIAFLGVRTGFRNREFEDWETLVRAQNTSYPGSAAGWFDSGNIFLSRGDWATAINEYETALRLRPEFWMGWMNLGTAYFGKGEPGLAMRALEKVLAGVKNDQTMAVVEARADYNRALILMQQNRNQEAAQALQRTLRIFPDHLAAHANLGMIFSNNDKFDAQALGHLRRAQELETDPDRMKALDDVILRIQQRRADLNRKQGVPLGEPAVDSTGPAGGAPAETGR